MTRWFIIALISLAVLLLQTTLIPFVAVGTIVPDLILIWVVVLGIARGQITAATVGFVLGLGLDLLAGDDGMLGLSSLTKTVAGFMAGYTFNENKTMQNLSSAQFPLTVAVVSLVHNLLYFVILLQGSGIRWWNAALFYGIPGMLYTTAVGVLPMFVIARKHLT